MDVVFLMDRFGYAKTIDTSAYERNKEAVHNENKYVFQCKNTDKICVFTDLGMMHSIKVMDIRMEDSVTRERRSTTLEITAARRSR